MTDTAGSRPPRTKRVTVVSTALIAIAALVLTGFALKYPGLRSTDVDVSDGGVWVTNENDGLLGRLNVDAGELDARLSSSGQDLDILQSGYTVIETGPRGMTVINTASITRNALVELPDRSEVALGGDRVAIASPAGQVWILSPEQAGAFSPGDVKPVLETSHDGVPPVAVGADGTVFVLDGSSLLEFPRSQDTRDTTAKDPVEVTDLSSGAEKVQLTAVGDRPVILDRENRLLRVGRDAKPLDLGAYGVASLDAAQLQQSGPAADTFVLATEDRLFVIPFGGGDPQEISAKGQSTEIARPAQAGGCAYGAWGGSNVFVRACEGQEPVADVIPEAHNGGELTLRQNRDLVVLNDQKFGLSWEITNNMELVDDWVIEQEIQTESTKEEKKETLTTTIQNTATERSEENRAPTAKDDTFGVRPGHNVVLPVTRNDSDPDGDVLTVSVDGKQPSIGMVTPIRGGTQLQIHVDEDASGTSSFTYKADDGRGGTDTATVTLEVRGEGENSPPEATDEMITKVKVRSGHEVSVNILPYWQDPDGDAFYLANATVPPQDLVTFRPDGLVTFNDAGLSPGTKEVELTFRDEHGAQQTGILQIESVNQNDLAPITTADHASIVAGRSATLKPLENDLNPNGGELELISVGASEGLEVEPVLEAGTVKVTAAEPGTHYLEYSVAASGASTASLGLIRIDVVAPEEEDLAPVAVDDMGTVTTGTDTLVDPLENDVDPTGGVLVVNSVEVPEGSGLKAIVVDHHLVRIEAEPGATIGTEPVPLTYTVANSAGTATGTIRAMVVATDTQFANPEAVPDRAVVRAGDIVDIDVLSNDHSPTDSKMHLGEELDSSRADDKGHTEPHGDSVRFHANDDAEGEAVVQYQVVDETGRTGSAAVRITIVPRDAGNEPPKPENLTARTVAGTMVRIPVPTSGLDPDGDSVMLTGITSPMPQLGEVTKADGGWIEYQPHDGAIGTDRFRYQVMDRNGAIGTAEVLVGIAAPNEANQPPYAVDDTIEVRPDREVQIPVLENDTDPEGAPLSVSREDVEALTEIEEIPPAEGQDDGYLTVVTPSEPGTHSVVYAASDGQLTSPATAIIKVSENAPLRAPVARDDFVPVEEVLDPEQPTIDVDVLKNDSDPDGSIHALTVELPDAPEGAQILEDGATVRVTPQEEQQRIRYVITDPDGLDSAGYVWVPGTAKQSPVWVGEPVTVQAGSTAEIDLSSPDNVRVRPGAGAAQVTEPDTVTALHHDGAQLVKDATTLVYTPAADFSGEDTITVEVTDGEVGDPTAAVGTLAIPVIVEAEEENLPPTFRGAELDVEQGGAPSALDLAAGAEDPERDELHFALGEGATSSELGVSLDGSTLRVEAGTKVAKGTVVDIPVTVEDGTNPPVATTVKATVSGSKASLISTGVDTVSIDAGKTDSVPVLNNDSNPFKDGKRTVTGATITSGTGEISLDGNEVVITPDEDFHGILTATYTVQDDTEDPDREVPGTIQVTVRGKPEAPSAPRIGEVGDGFVVLSFSAGADNGAPITGYEVTSASGPAVSAECASTTCTIDGLSNNTEYTFQVAAKNDVGTSEPSAASAVARPDVRPDRPAPPSAERGDKQLTVTWSAPENRGSPIQKYTVQMQNTATGALSTQQLEAGTLSTVFDGLANGTDYRFRVQAENLADRPSDFSDWSSSEHPAGKPLAPAGTPTAKRVDDPKGGGITVSWPAMTTAEANGEPIQKYIVTASSGATMEVPASQTSTTFRGLDAAEKHTFTYRGVNSVGTGENGSKTSNAVVPWAKPSAPATVTASMPDEGTGDGPNGRANVSWSAADGNGTPVTSYIVRWGGQSKVVEAPATSTSISGLTNGTAYRFTVEARNGFANEGGVSTRSKESNSITPYTKPAAPTVSTSAAKCTGSSKCPVTFNATATGSDGGAGGKTLQVRINGGKWENVSGTSFTRTVQMGSGKTGTIEARVKNAKGLYSSTAKKSQKAQKWVPAPTPKIVNAGRAGSAVNEQNCTSGYCYFIDFTVTNLEPNTEYTYCIQSTAGSGGCWYPVESDGITPKWGTLTTNSSGEWRLRADGRSPYWGHPYEDMWITVRVKSDSSKSGDSNHVRI